MRIQYGEARAEQIEIQRTIEQGGARLCVGNFGKAWKGIFPHKAAEELAARCGYKAVRTAQYELSGEREPSARAIAALVNACMPERNEPRQPAARG